MKTLQDITLGDLLPDSISSDQQVKQSAEAIDPELKTVSGFLLLGAVLANVDKLTSTQLDHIAYSFDLTTWRDYWPLSQKRQVAKTVVAQKCRMGTLSAVKKSLSLSVLPFRLLSGGRKHPRTHLTRLRLLPPSETSPEG